MNRCSSESQTWEHITGHEKKFLNKLGVHYEHTKKTRLELLTMYKLLMKTRLRWGKINKEVIEKHVDRLIVKEGLKCLK